LSSGPSLLPLKPIAILLSLFAADQPVETDPRLPSGGEDKFHWSATAYKIIADQCVESVSKALSAVK
jgi:hypothetical protein